MKINVFLALPLLLASSLYLSSCNDPAEEGCGNGIIDFGESCDGLDVGGITCGDIPALGKYSGGFLGCTDQCIMDTSSCDPCFGYPCEPESGYGDTIGDVIPDLEFDIGNLVASQFGERNDSPELFALSHPFKEGISKGGKWKAALVFFTTGWCPPCKLEAEVLANEYAKYKEQGILFIGVALEDTSGQQATGAYAQEHGDNYNWDFPSVAGSTPELARYWPDPNQVAYPMNMLLDLNDMTIMKAETGSLASPAALANFVAPALEEDQEDTSDSE